MLTQEQNELLCKTDPGTPCGEMMRRYWQPVGVSREVPPGGKPRQVKVMGEDLVLFRDNRGQAGLLGLHCSHRLTSLAYGRVEDGGIRCPFHGWLYDVEGKCLEQPAEPEFFGEKIRHLAYPCQELGGLIFTYMGPINKMPLLPRYEVLVREDGTRKVDYYQINSNYLQNVEGAVDTVHANYLHMDNWSKVKQRLASMPKQEVHFQETNYGIWQKTYGPSLSLSSMRPLYTYFFMPAGFVRIQENSRGVQKFQSWYVPIDDTHNMRFQAAFAPLRAGCKPYEWSTDEQEDVQLGLKDYYRNYEEFDTISGIPAHAPGSAIKGFLVQDNMANETQGPIVDRTKEHLGSLDKVLSAMRIMYLVAIEDVRNERDPKHIIRDPGQNEVVYIRGNEELELA